MHPLETYLTRLREIRDSGAATKETSGYGVLAELLNAAGQTLKPKVSCIIQLQNSGAGLPDGGLFTQEQLKRSDAEAPLRGVTPARGVIEVKSTADEVAAVAQTGQVKEYLRRYGQLLLTNYRGFLLLQRGSGGSAQCLEGFSLAPSEQQFWRETAAHPRKTADTMGDRLLEYLKRGLLHAAPIAAPEMVAWFLASYARDARLRIEAQPDLPALAAVRTALEEALGLKFQDAKGERFFRSTLVQTLFYGVFSAWVLWHREDALRADQFRWRDAARFLRVPVLRKLFYQLAEPGQLDELNLSELLEWAGAVLNRVDRASFFAAFTTGHEIQYFYEPFLQAFDPELRKELGVWYTPSEIVQYQVARVDMVLREELGIADGLADERVYVLDPCCGTGAYLVEVLRKIAAALKDKLGDALHAAEVKKAATERVFGFELLPAPFVVAHLQLGLLLQSLGAPLTGKKSERIGVFLTNALTGWEPPKEPKQHLLFKEFEDERDAANHVKLSERILVILGNPPYNGFAGVAVAEERDLSNAYRTTKRAPAPQGQGLNDLYVRFFRMAERRIVEMNQPAQGVVCFISNYSWLDGLSFTGMRERYLEAFDQITIDCLNGDKYKTGKLTPDGQSDPSVFSTEFNREGIQVGTAIATLVRRGALTSGVHLSASRRKQRSESDGSGATPQPARGTRALPGQISFRHLWGKTKRADLLAGPGRHEMVTPALGMGLSFMPGQVASGYLAWPLLPELFPVSFPGVKTSRDLALVEIDLETLQRRMGQYFDPEVTDEDVSRISPALMTSTQRFDAKAARKVLLGLGLKSGQFVRFAYRPFDTRHLYWHPETKLLDEKREDLFGMFQAGNLFLTSRQKGERHCEGTPFFVTRNLPDWHLTRPGSACLPLLMRGFCQPEIKQAKDGQSDFLHEFAPRRREKPLPTAANLSTPARQYLASVGLTNPDADEKTAGILWMHMLAIGHSRAYLAENAGALRQDWPRAPLAATKESLLASAALGRQIAALLDTETPVPGVTTGQIRPELKGIAVFTLPPGKDLDEETDFAVTAGWGHAGQGGVTMPGKGKLVQRDGARDVCLNDSACWRNVPAAVWDYTIGGYQVMKKWLSYREKGLLGRSLTLDEIKYATEMARRIAALILLQPELDRNYQRVKAATAALDR